MADCYANINEKIKKYYVDYVILALIAKIINDYVHIIVLHVYAFEKSVKFL